MKDMFAICNSYHFYHFDVIKADRAFFSEFLNMHVCWFLYWGIEVDLASWGVENGHEYGCAFDLWKEVVDILISEAIGVSKHGWTNVKDDTVSLYTRSYYFTDDKDDESDSEKPKANTNNCHCDICRWVGVGARSDQNGGHVATDVPEGEENVVLSMGNDDLGRSGVDKVLKRLRVVLRERVYFSSYNAYCIFVLDVEIHRIPVRHVLDCDWYIRPSIEDFQVFIRILEKIKYCIWGRTVGCELVLTSGADIVGLARAALAS